MSEELKALKRIASIQVITDVEKDIVEHAIDITPFAFALIESALKEKEKQDKILQIIKECFSINGFGELIPNSKFYESEEKEDLLREWLK